MLLIGGCSGDDGGDAAPSTMTTAASPTSAPGQTSTGITVGGRADDVFVPLDGYEYVEPPAAVLDRFTAGFEARPGATEVVDSVAARTVVPREGDADRGVVVVSIAIAEGVGPLAAGFQEGVLGSLSAEGSPEAVEIGGRPATLADTGGQQALYLQDGTAVLFFVGASGREELLAVAEALASRL